MLGLGFGSRIGRVLLRERSACFLRRAKGRRVRFARLRELGLVLRARLGELCDLGVEIGLVLFGLALEVVRALAGLVLVALGGVRCLLEVDRLLLQVRDAIV